MSWRDVSEKGCTKIETTKTTTVGQDPQSDKSVN